MSAKLLEAVVIALLAGCSAWAGVLIARALRAGPAERTQRLPGALLWGGLCARAIAAWPAGVDAARFPVTALWMIAPLACLPWVWAEGRPAEARERAQRATDVLLRALLGLLLVVGVGWSIATRRAIGGVDFWYYICNARDLADGVPDPAGAHYFYFPGVYWFWRVPLAVLGRGLPGLQWTFLGLVAANAAAVAALVFRSTRSALWTTLAVVFLLLLFGSSEILEATTEPLVTLAAAAGLLGWDRSRRGAVLLGAGLGAAFLAKQQGGLLALGWLGPVLLCATGREERSRLRTLLWVPLSASVIAAAGLLLAGGRDALVIGLRSAANYPSEDNLASNLFRLFRHLPSLAIALFVAAAALALASDQHEDDRPRRTLLSFTLVAALATLLQFEKRAYLHYALLTAPMAVVASTIGASMLLRRLRPLLAASPLIGCSLAAVVAVEAASMVSGFPYLLQLIKGRPVEAPFDPWAPAAEDLAEVARHVEQGEQLLLLAPSQNRLQFVLGTRSPLPHRYGWGLGHPGTALEAARSPAVHSVLVPSMLSPDTALPCLDIGCEQALRALPSLGYRPVVQRPTLTLWRRP